MSSLYYLDVYGYRAKTDLQFDLYSVSLLDRYTQGLLFPGPSAQLKNQFFPSSDVMHMSALKNFQLKSSILSALMTSLDGKNWFFS